MFEAKILQGLVLKKIIEAIRELVQEANLECTDRSITMQVHLIEFTSDHSLICLVLSQAMDSSHVSLCAVVLKAEGFDHYRCDKPFALGMNFPNFAKILKCAGNDDVVTLRCEEDTDSLTMVFESPNQDRVSDFEFKLMAIETEHLGIPDTEYKCSVRMPSAEFQRIIRDIAVFGDTCKSFSALHTRLILSRLFTL